LSSDEKLRDMNPLARTLRTIAAETYEDFPERPFKPSLFRRWFLPHHPGAARQLFAPHLPTTMRASSRFRKNWRLFRDQKLSYLNSLVIILRTISAYCGKHRGCVARAGRTATGITAVAF
jgi:hypothetical protein